MKARLKSCPKCGFGMTDGIIGFDHLIRWHSAKEEGIKEEDLKSVRDVELKKNRGQTLRAHRCTYCGYVEFFCPA